MHVAEAIPLENLSKRYFFESDMLFHLAIIRAKVVEILMRAVYANEESSMSILNTIFTFPFLNARNTIRRLFFNYFRRGFSIASLNFFSGLVCWFLELYSERWLGARVC